MNNQKYQNWLEKEKNKDKVELDIEKENFINLIKKYNKEDIIPTKPKKVGLWKKLMKIITS